ncbi:hypothetical protein C5Q97_07095 [Victivallales bacterium CCUG 44730]|nr:hypothetical protein C5Q97_07095 [Victivallales bacterium CCUG 44730]
MLDLPVPDNNSIIIFSATGGGSNEGGRLRQNIGFSSLTALTLSGGIENDFVRVTPSGSSFEVKAKFHKAQGSATFSVTATTAGDPARNLEPATVGFTFRVLVLGVDLPHLTRSFFEFAVGETVDVGLPLFYAAPEVQLNIAKVPAAIASLTHGELRTETDHDHGDIQYSVWEGAPSGISLAPVLDYGNNVRGARLTGIAIRPGIYYVNFVISSYDNSGSYDPFPGANGAGLVIINIYDDRESPKIAVPVRYAANPDFVRAIRHGFGDNYTAARLTGEFTRSEEVWTRRISETISGNVSDVWEYRLERDESGVWTLSGRNYRSDQEAPEFSVLATAPDRFGEVPPNTGWSGGLLLAGDGVKFVPGYGFFDWKGERELTVDGEVEPFRGPVYEQQPMVSAQYGGWNNPPALQYDSGLYLAPGPDGKWRISADPDALEGTEVEPRGIEMAAVPYAPPTAAALGGTAYRDVTAAGVPLNAHLEPGGLTLRRGSGTAAVKPHYTFLRQAVPQANAGPERSVPFSVVQEQSDDISDEYQNGMTHFNYDNGEWYTYRTFTEKHGNPVTKSNFSGTLPLNAWTRTAPDLISGVLGGWGLDLPAGFDYTFDNATRHYWGSSDIRPDRSDWGSTDSRETTTERINEIQGKHGWGLGSFGSGRDAGDAAVGCVAVGAVGAGLTCSTIRTWSRTETSSASDRPPETKEWGPETSDRGAVVSLTAITPMFAYVPPGGLAFDSVSSETVTATLEGLSERYVRDQDGNYLESHAVSVKMEHYHKSYSGTLPPGLVSRGWTKIEKTENGETTVEWHDDPTGSVYESSRGEFGVPDAIGEPSTDGRERTSYSYWSKRSERRNTLTESMG